MYTLPTSGGQRGEYTSAEAQRKAGLRVKDGSFFVNGMGNSPTDHADSAVALSLLQGCTVIGVFNQSNGFWSDIGQCLSDKLNLTRPQSGSFTAWQTAIDLNYALARKIKSGLTKVGFVGGLIQDNPATKSLYDLLTGAQGVTQRRVPIFCHSQGNLITSNALTAVSLALGQGAIAGIEVNSFGSPCRYWPKGLRHVQRAFTFDPVTWLDLRAGFQFDKVGFVAAHGFLEYIKHDAEFTVNRFRWGGWGMTANMDEKGLATYLVKMGNNHTRLEAVFTRLIDAHWADSDDVAHIYCKKMRETQPGLYTRIFKGSPKVAALLVRCLDEGITTRGERLEIDFIKGVA